MNDVRIIHREAMQWASKALLAKRDQDREEALRLFQKAFDLEKQAADLLVDVDSLEPTRSVLHRSAASLALECGNLEAVERLAIRGLAGSPPGEIAEELRNILEMVLLLRHWQLTDNTLALTAFTDLEMRAVVQFTRNAEGHPRIEYSELVPVSSE
jgi:hypothetical protein